MMDTLEKCCDYENCYLRILTNNVDVLILSVHDNKTGCIVNSHHL